MSIDFKPMGPDRDKYTPLNDSASEIKQKQRNSLVNELPAATKELAGTKVSDEPVRVENDGPMEATPLTLLFNKIFGEKSSYGTKVDVKG